MPGGRPAQRRGRSERRPHHLCLQHPQGCSTRESGSSMCPAPRNEPRSGRSTPGHSWGNILKCFRDSVIRIPTSCQEPSPGRIAVSMRDRRGLKKANCRPTAKLISCSTCGHDEHEMHKKRNGSKNLNNKTNGRTDFFAPFLADPPGLCERWVAGGAHCHFNRYIPKHLDPVHSQMMKRWGDRARFAMRTLGDGQVGISFAQERERIYQRGSQFRGHER